MMPERTEDMEAGRARDRAIERPRCAAAAAIVATGLLALQASPCDAGIHIDLREDPVPAVTGASEGDRLGYSLASGDLDADGSAELAAGAPGMDAGPDLIDAGGVLILDAELLASLSAPTAADSLPGTILRGTHAHERFGEVLLVDDLNGDSTPDLAVGAPSWGATEKIFSGRVYVFLGPTDRSDSLACADAADAIVEGMSAGDRFGSSLASGDIDGDGHRELLVSAPRSSNEAGARPGSIYAIRVDSLPRDGRPLPAAEACSIELRGQADGDALRGIAVSPGEGERPTLLAAGAYHADGADEKEIDAGKVYLVDGGRLSRSILSVSEAAPSLVLGPHPRAFLGRSIATGDVDGDGIPDLALSAYASRGKGSKADASGEVFILYGLGSPPPGMLRLSDASLPRFTSSARWDLFGLPVLLCDLNGDGRSDLIVSAQFADSGNPKRKRCGSVYVFRGGPRSVVEAKTGKADLADVIITGANAFDAIGASLATVVASGRYPDLAVGAPDARGALLEEAAGSVLLVPSAAMSARRE